MTSTVFTTEPNTSVELVAKMMLENNVGSIIIEPKEGEAKALGIVTERDIVTRVVALGKNPAEVLVDEIATRPVVTVPPNLNITETMKLMTKLNIRRVVVVEGNNIVGIVTYRDLLKVAPTLLEIALEYEKIGFGNDKTQEELDFAEDYDRDDKESNPSGLTVGFYCSKCGDWCEETPIYELEEQPVCEDCYNLYQ